MLIISIFTKGAEINESKRTLKCLIHNAYKKFRMNLIHEAKKMFILLNIFEIVY